MLEIDPQKRLTFPEVLRKCGVKVKYISPTYVEKLK